MVSPGGSGSGGALLWRRPTNLALKNCLNFRAESEGKICCLNSHFQNAFAHACFTFSARGFAAICSGAVALRTGDAAPGAGAAGVCAGGPDPRAGKGAGFDSAA